MKVKMNGKSICCLLAVILFFMGIGVEVSAVDSLSSRTIFSDYGQSTIDSHEEVMVDSAVCTPNMLRSEMRLSRGSKLNNIVRWQMKSAVVFLVVGNLLQFLFYQSLEGKEDGQLFACRTMIVDYIHLRDSGE